MESSRDSLLDIESGSGPESGAALNQLYRSLVDNSLQGLLLVERGRLVFANRTAEKLVGYTASELRALPKNGFLEFVHPDDRARAGACLEAHIRGKPAAECHEIRAVRKDGSVRWLEMFPTVLELEGRVMVQVAFLDVTDRRLAVDALREREERLRLIFDHARDAIFVHGMEPDGAPGRIVEVNDIACKRLGFGRPELLGMSLSALCAPERRDAVKEFGTQLMRDGEVMYETEHVARDATRIPVEVNACVFVYNGVPTALSFARDISERKLAERALRDKDAALLQAQKLEAIGRLAGGIAHDFNNILGIISGSCGIVEMQLEPGSALQEDVAEIAHAADRATQLTRKLLAFGSNQMLQPEAIDLNEAVAETHRMLRRLIGEHIEIVTLLAADPGYVKADRSSLEQILVNLAVNARDAMPDGGKLVLETVNIWLHGDGAASALGVAPGPYVALTVTDTGCGIDAETLPRIFDPFFTTKERGKGTGLGLSTVYGIVKQNGGAINADSVMGRGTSFRMYLPECSKDEAEAESKRASTAPPRGTETILVAEDEPALRQVLARALIAAGYEVLEACDGAEAIRLAEGDACEFQLLATDIIMPKLGGYELALRLRRARPTLPILFMSGHIERVRPEDLTSMGGCAFLPKPVSVKNLARVVRSLLDGRPPSSR